MAAAPLGTLLHQIHRLASPAGPRTDPQLLDDFARSHDEAAFAALVARHGPMVLRVCRRALGNHHDAEDAFQATFLVLAQHSSSIRQREALAGWLHGVAYRTAMKAKRGAARRRHHEARLVPSAPQVMASPGWGEVQAALDEELQRLPERFRAAFVFRVLEGRSIAEAAAALGCKAATVSTRLSRARQLLRQRLVRRGIELSALLAAAAVADGAGRAAAPAALAKGAVRYGLLVAAGGAAAGTIPSHVASLAAGVTRAMFLTKAKIATALLLAVALAAGAGVLAHRAVASAAGGGPKPAAPPAAASPSRPAAATPPAAEADRDAVTYAGRVVGPDGKPVAGAKVYYHFITRTDEPVPARAVTDARGRFAFALGRKDVPLTAEALRGDPRSMGQVVVKADDYTFAWRFGPPPKGDLELHVARDDTPVTGRVIDLQGKPAAGLRVSVLMAAAPEKGDLTDFLKALRAGESFYPALMRHVPNLLFNPLIGGHVSGGLLPTATTDADGRFRLPGFGREQVVSLRLEGAAIETQDLYVVTRPLTPGSGRLLTPPRIKDPVFGPDAAVIVVGNGFEHAAPPGQIVVGSVRDAATGEPIPDAIVETYQLAGTRLAQNAVYHIRADGRGRYRFTGLPRGKGNRLRIRPPQDRPYLPVVKDVPPAEPFTEVTLDAALNPGVWVDVTATDEANGKPVPGYVSYFALPEKRTPETRFRPRPYADAYDDMMATRSDGTFRFVAAPGKAVLAFRADWDKYPIAREAATVWLPGGLPPSNFQAFAAIDPKPGDGPVKVAFRLSAERVVKGRLVGPDGRPVVGALASALRDDWFWDPVSPLKTDGFKAMGLDPARPRLLCFVQREKKLAGSVVVRGDEKGPLTVRLQPWATVTGRLLDAEGRPIKNTDLAFTEVPARKPGQPMSLDTGLHVVTHFAGQPSLDPKTDGEGRFRVEGLVPGLKYNLALYERGAVDFEQIRWDGLAFRGLVLRPGEARDLGDVKLQPFPKK